MFKNRIIRGFTNFKFWLISVSVIILTGMIAANAQVTWQPTNGPYGGNVFDLGINSSGVIYTAAQTGVFASGDDGNNWNDITSNLPGQELQCIAVSPTNGHLFVGSYNNFLYRSDDYGANWVLINNGLPTSFSVNNLLINSDGYILAACNDNLYRSINDGDTWEAITGFSSGGVVDLYINDGGWIFAATYNDVFVSIDAGLSWNPLYALAAAEFSKNAIAVNAANEIFIGSFEGVRRSTNNGQTWNFINTGLPTTGDVTDLVIDTDGNIFAGTTNGFYISTDNGENWSEASTNLLGRGIHKILLNSAGNLFLGTFDGVFFSSNQGDLWFKVNNGLNNTIITALHEHTNGNFYAGSMTGLFRSTDNGTNWSEIPELAGKHIHKIISKDNGYIFIGTELDGIYRSPDNGANWDQANNGLTGLEIRAMTVNSAGEPFIVTYDGVYQTTDNGNNWIKKTTTYLEATDMIADVDTLYVTTYSGLQKSEDNGVNWFQVNPAGPFTSGQRLAWRDDGYMFASSNDGVYRSDDKGFTWTQKSNGLTTLDVATVYINRKGHIFAGTLGGGVFQSTNLGENWTAINSGLDPNRIAALLINNEGVFLAGTQARGVYSSSYDNSIYTAVPIALEFGSVRTATGKTDSVVVTNTGYREMTVGPFALSGTNAAHFSIITTEFVLNPGESKGIVMTYTPPAATPSSASLDATIAGEPVSIPLSGNGIAPVLQVNKTALPFNNQRVGVAKTDSVQVTNIGSAGMQVTSLQIAGTDAVSFTVTNEPFTLEQEAARQIYIEFLAERSGEHNATLTINSDGGNETISLTGTGIAPLLSPLSSTVSVGNMRTNSTKTLSNTPLITNSGADSLNVTSAIFSGTDAASFTVTALPPKIAPGENGAFTVTFTPTRTGSHTATLNIESDGGAGQIIFTGTGVTPVLQVLPGTLNFTTGITTTSYDTIYVTNTGTDSLIVSEIIISGVNAANFNLSTPTPFEVEVGENVKLPVAFSPTVIGAYTAQVTIQSDGGIGQVSLVGTGSQAVVQVVPTTLPFGSVTIGSSSTDSVTVINGGSVILNITSIVLGGANPGQFSTNPAAFSLAPATSRKVPVTFSPTAAGTFSASLVINSNGGNPTVSLSGSGVTPVFSANATTLNFGPVAVSASRSDTITVTNTGSGELLIYETFLSGPNVDDFSIANDQNEIPIYESESLDFPVTFTPQSAGSKSAMIVFYHNAASSPDTIQLAGTGGEPIFATDKEALAFGQVNVGATKYDTITVINNGSGNLVINAVGITGANRSEFALATPVQTWWSLPSLGAQKFAISFTPATSGSKTATLVISANDSGIPHSIPLSGTATDISLSVTTPVANYESAYTLTASLSSTTWTPEIMKLYYRQGGKSVYDSTDMTLNNTTISAIIPAQAVTLRGLEYYIRLSNGSTTLTYPAMDTATQPAIIQVYASHYIPPLDLLPMKYHMVSAPGILLHPSVLLTFMDDYGDYDNTRWRLTYYDAAAENGFAEYPFDPLQPHIVYPGKVFWLITRDGKMFDVENITSLATDESYSTVLQPGWNQVANPFAFPVYVEHQQAGEYLEPPIYWNPAINDYQYNVFSLNPWEGYFVYNRSLSPVTVTILPVEYPSTLPRSALPITAAGSDYVLQLAAKIPGTDAVDTQNYLGLLKGALDGSDKTDFCEAPPVGDYVRLSIIADGKRYAGNFKPIAASGNKWDLTLNTSLANMKKVSISLSETGSLPDSMNVYVFDKDYGAIIPVTNNNFTVNISGNKQTRNFMVIIGTTAFAQNNNDGIPLVPYSFALEQNYPNPFNPETTIRYRLARQEHVKLEIFNTLGSKVATLVDGVQTTGEHAAVWNGRANSGAPVAGGVYFYRLGAGQQTFTRKMILIR